MSPLRPPGPRNQSTIQPSTMRKVSRPKMKTGEETRTASSAVIIPLKAKSAKKRRKSRFRFTKPKVKKLPGFDAFKVTKETADGITETKVISPEHGIHSLEWALATPVQDSPFLKLPVEVRNKIYELVFYGLTICPYKKGKKFKNVDEAVSQPLMILYSDLSLVCRQLYIDTVGGALLYRVATFSFDSPQLMRNYISAINPAHKDAIRAINLRIPATLANPNLPAWPFKTLAALPNLQSLEIGIFIDYHLCDTVFLGSRLRTSSTLKESVLLILGNEKVWMRLRGSQLTALEVRFKEGRAPHRTPFVLAKDDPKMMGFGEFVRGLIGLRTQ